MSCYDLLALALAKQGRLKGRGMKKIERKIGGE
jgi:hypothetical protein